MKPWVKISFALLLLCRSGLAQGFLNMDFESANVSGYPVGGEISAADAFPGWTVGGSGTFVFYNGFSVGAPAVTLVGPDLPNGSGLTPLEGSYSVLLVYFGIAGSAPTLSQTGLIPVGTESINFLVGSYDSDAVVTLNGVNIPLVSISGGRLAGNVSAFAGMVAQLTFSTTSNGPYTPNELYFDDVQFSTSSVPEPSEFTLTALGALLLGFRRRLNSFIHR
jgi:hypothetical protein